MKHLLLLILLILPLSCYNGLNDMYDNLGMKVPICVDATGGDDGNDGRGWRNAYQTLQAAIAAADDGDEIWVAEGTNYINSSVTISKSIKIYGGFKGDESRLDHRTPNANMSVISKNGTDPIRFQFDSAINVIFDGLTFAGFTSSVFFMTNSAEVTSKNCNFYTNTGEGAIYAQGSKYRSDNCRFENNNRDASNGGAITLDNSTAEIIRSVFDNNQALNGGAIYAFGMSTVTISDNCEFYRNRATHSSGAGGAININNTTLNISRTKFGDGNEEFSGNTAEYQGGAIYIFNGSNVTISENTQFYRNSSVSTSSAGGGGAIYVNNSTLNVSRAFFGSESIADNGNNSPNGSATGGAIRAEAASTVTISDNTQFYRNSSAGQGGAIYLNDSTLNVTNSILGGDSSLTGNKSTTSGGGAIYAVDNCDITMSGTRIRYNSANASGGGIFTSGGTLYLNNSTYIQNNNSSFYGGGIYAETTTVNISDSFVLNNFLTSPGGGMRFSSCTGTIINTGISGNSTGGSGTGGGISFDNTEDNNKTLTIQRSRFIGNRSGVSSSVGGGAIQFHSDQSDNNLVITGTDFDSNSITGTGGGGAIYFNSSGSGSSISMEACIVRNTPTERGAAVYISSGQGNQFVNTLFYNNNHESTSSYGGALWLGTSSLLVNLTFFNNSASNGGAVYLAGSGTNYYMFNTVFYNNTDTNAGTGTDNLNTAANVSLHRFNCFYNGGVSVAVASTIEDCIIDNSSDPFLNSSDPSNSNFMRPGSLLVDAGYTGTIAGFTMPATDLAGNTRIRGGAIDIGAYERQ